MTESAKLIDIQKELQNLEAEVAEDSESVDVGRLIELSKKSIGAVALLAMGAMQWEKRIAELEAQVVAQQQKIKAMLEAMEDIEDSLIGHVAMEEERLKGEKSMPFEEFEKELDSER